MNDGDKDTIQPAPDMEKRITPGVDETPIFRAGLSPSIRKDCRHNKSYAAGGLGVQAGISPLCLCCTVSEPSKDDRLGIPEILFKRNTGAARK